ncbi:hypothetical protein HOS55_gp034 [Pseudomonas phage PMBT3]|uniref:Uncharacterized protein n=1 Tax=Pseudomonas phage PMBT3 TaxID=2059856 RepID=A0A2I6PHW1_9CAUD|nr:hypothetical protein HOS55_gp034 [Pseudomonas phage PMBT3]AUM59636.1 hypothetical protein [Pseudomonas phage PMBT3]
MKQVVHNPADYTDDSTAWNDPGSLAPVGSDIMIQMPTGTAIHHPEWPDAAISNKDEVVQVKRTAHISDKTRAMRYELLDGSYVFGRFRWTHG